MLRRPTKLSAAELRGEQPEPEIELEMGVEPESEPEMEIDVEPGMEIGTNLEGSLEPQPQLGAEGAESDPSPEPELAVEAEGRWPEPKPESEVEAVEMPTPEPGGTEPEPQDQAGGSTGLPSRALSSLATELEPSDAGGNPAQPSTGRDGGGGGRSMSAVGGGSGSGRSRCPMMVSPPHFTSRVLLRIISPLLGRALPST
jgi:hypothetical protein